LAEEEAATNSEEPVQLVEGLRYDYKFENLLPGGALTLACPLRPSAVRRSRAPFQAGEAGTIEPGLYPGRLPLCAYSPDGMEQATAAVEVRSAKLGYREEYRNMLSDIADWCGNAVLMTPSSGAETRFAPDPGNTFETVQERFFFIRGILKSRAFEDAMSRICAMPHEALRDEDEMLDIRRLRRISGRELRRLASGAPRIPVPPAHPLSQALATVPARVQTGRKALTTDTPPNRFVKHALGTFASFLASMRERLARLGAGPDGVTHLLREIDRLSAGVGDRLHSGFLRQVSDPHVLPSGNPVLQRRQGYREVYRAYLLFSAAANLSWEGGQDVYGAGARDVATLYEYWVYFRLLRVVASVFELDAPPASELLEPREDGLGLRLKAGRHVALGGGYRGQGRRLKVRFSYNRSFKREAGAPTPCGEGNYPSPGSWTVRMRPDYTLSLWPEECGSEADAERDELAVHVHFDAKYRVDDIAEQFGQGGAGDEEDLREEKREQLSGIYKRGDILKMHAYRDAIRRSGGAYVLYPGDINRNWLGYHELLPGLGAFPLRPGGGGLDGSTELARFISDVAAHVCDRATRRESEGYQRKRIQGGEPPLAVREDFPEYAVARHRQAPPQDTHVLCVWHKGTEQLEWVRRKGLVIVRAEDRRGSLYLGPERAGARYILLHGEGGKAEPGLLAVAAGADGQPLGPRVFSADKLRTDYGYPLPLSGEVYLVFEVAPAAGFDKYSWDFSTIQGKPAGRESAKPFPVTLDRLMQAARAASGAP
jgi:predicted component of viral defense system (DUF524 family)